MMPIASGLGWAFVLIRKIF